MARCGGDAFDGGAQPRLLPAWRKRGGEERGREGKGRDGRALDLDGFSDGRRRRVWKEPFQREK